MYRSTIRLKNFFCNIFLNKAQKTKMERRDLACENVRVHG